MAPIHQKTLFLAWPENNVDKAMRPINIYFKRKTHVKKIMVIMSKTLGQKYSNHKSKQAII